RRERRLPRRGPSARRRALPHARAAAPAPAAPRPARAAAHQHLALRDAMGAAPRRRGVLGPALRPRQAAGHGPGAAGGRQRPAPPPPARARHRLGPGGDLRFVEQEAEAICEALEPIADIECVSGRLATFDAVTTYLGQGFDLIHYCGHLVASAGANPALLLAEEQTLSAAAIEANVAGRPLVFLNACASARGEGRPGERAWEATASSVVHGFLFGGAVAVVGTLCEVADRHAAALAVAFYRGALERLPIGEALRAARAECRAEPE